MSATPSATERSLPRLSTLALHGGSEHLPANQPVVSPLVQSVNFTQEPGTTDGLRYTRYGNGPNAELVQKRLALLEGADAALLLSSGMGATACAMMALLRPGDHLVSSSWIYGGTHRLFTQEFAQLGIEVTLVDPGETRGWRRGIRKETRAIFVESPVNPTASAQSRSRDPAVSRHCENPAFDTSSTGTAPASSSISENAIPQPRNLSRPT
jgi:O-acetylhomoserine/O-acetylserine sulfhydrylase-like pyridoxal-dependent enzyme